MYAFHILYEISYKAKIQKYGEIVEQHSQALFHRCVVVPLIIVRCISNSAFDRFEIITAEWYAMVWEGTIYPPIFIETGMHIWKGRNQISSRSSLEMIMISIQCTLNGRTVLNWGKSVWFFFLWFRFNFNAITLNANWTKRIEVNVKRWAGTSIIRNV